MSEPTQNIDPVCGMKVNPQSERGLYFKGARYLFCSDRCLTRFNENPEKYVANGPANDAHADESSFKTYFPLILIAIYLVGGVALYEILASAFDGMRMMMHFMGWFFVIFSFFKFLDLKSFADAYKTYDVIAKSTPAYGFVYPFLELALGIAYLSGFNPKFTNLATMIIMGVSSIGVLLALSKKQQIQCACLGTVFKLPMSTITAFEDLLMFGMAVFGFLNY